MDVPYFDLKAQYASIREEVLAVIDGVCRDAAFVLGREVAAFEQEFAAYCGTKHCVALNSGTSALHLALLAAGVGPGDEVITTANTFIATAEAITYTGARPVFVDIDPATANLDPRLVEPAITPRTKAILPVHLYGRPFDIEAMREVARRHRLALIEDACQAHGARFAGQPVGGFGLAATFSFYPSKNLGAYGEGGALTTNDAEVAEFARQMRDHGSPGRYFHDRVGYNYRMDGFQGAVLRIKLRRLEEWNAKRRAFAKTYRALLGGSPVVMPADDPRAECAYHLFVVWVENRERVKEALEARGVHTAVHYPRPLYLQKAYAGLGCGPGRLPHTEWACQRVLSMPLYPEMPAEHVEYAAKALAEIASIHGVPLRT
jgi:dTDP-4-amino-4,6-dideoxygalactose transaminase